ncbi:MAG: UDP-N-acetyl-D-mannosamine dehydrogenase [Actinobacteria bacterium]|nr:UDP-N-acetyl-D-mannosamine dehydrogenase [Actinomycetota bacterium]
MSGVTQERVCVLGLGYIGLPTAVVLSTRGVDVIGVDVNADVVASVNRGEVLFVEPDLAVAVSGAVAMGRLSARSEPVPADAFIIAVPTPLTSAAKPDLSYVEAATQSIATQLRGGEVVILESTSPPGTTEQVSRWLAQLRPDLRFPHEGKGGTDVFVAHCPERVIPGRTMIEILTNNRVVGGVGPACAERAAGLYRIFCQGDIVLTDAASAEMAKLVENSYRDVNIAFANELSAICDHLRLDVWEVIQLANLHPRVNILEPGPGVGGHCIAVDPWFLVAATPNESRLIRMAREVNDFKPERIVAQVATSASRFREPIIACLGLSYKANIDDLRESPAVTIVAELSRRLPEASLLVAEPHVDDLPAPLRDLANVRLVSAGEAVDTADIVVLLVDHDQFDAVKRVRLDGRVVFDTRGFWRNRIRSRSAGA